MSPTSEEMEVLRECEHFESLLQHPGFQKLVEVAQKQVLGQWTALLTTEPAEIQRVQGFIEGANFVLEYVDAKVVQAELVRKHSREAERATLESQFASQAQQRERGRRRVVPGATLD